MVAKPGSVTAAVTCAIVLAGLAGCLAPPPRVPPVAKPDAAVDVARPAAATTYPVDPARTVVTVVVRRAGPLARLGHDHVITSADERGTVWLGASPAESTFELYLPVERFDVDLPEARAAAGPEFATPVPEGARAGTRQNLLRPAVLDAATWPEIMLRSAGASGDWPAAAVQVAVTFKGVERVQTVPVLVTREADGVVATGALQLRQTDFGITPFSVAGGAIQVADVLEVSFVIAATRR
jgi:polyisoprenoid-binding protein YceI